MKDVSNPNTLLVSASTMQALFNEILLKNGLPNHQAKVCAEVFTINSLDGVYSHGVNRFSKFVSLIQQGFIKPSVYPVMVNSTGAMEQWDGQSGVGITNALACTERSMELAENSGIGCVALANTNHWMRAGTYARHAASNGYVLMAWTNTIRNTPAWGATDARLGNNPLTIGVPFENKAIVLDMAMSQFSYGALELYAMKGQQLPIPGGFDEAGNITTDPAAILKSQRPLPIGYWKGSGLSLLLDILSTIFSGGLSVAEISKHSVEINLSQVFIAFNINKLKQRRSIQEALQQIISDFKESLPADGGSAIRYPGEKILNLREENHKKGIPVVESVWRNIISLNEA